MPSLLQRPHHGIPTEPPAPRLLRGGERSCEELLARARHTARREGASPETDGEGTPGDNKGEVIPSGTSQVGLRCGVSLTVSVAGGGEWGSLRLVLVASAGKAAPGCSSAEWAMKTFAPCCHQGDDGATTRRPFRTVPGAYWGPAQGRSRPFLKVR